MVYALKQETICIDFKFARVAGSLKRNHMSQSTNGATFVFPIIERKEKRHGQGLGHPLAAVSLPTLAVLSITYQVALVTRGIRSTGLMADSSIGIFESSPASS